LLAGLESVVDRIGGVMGVRDEQLEKPASKESGR